MDHYKKSFLEYLQKKLPQNKSPKSLYDPVSYILSLGGKRVRPLCVLMACEMVGHDFKKALDCALAVEIFHNFSLVHDDIMDCADLRRGKQTVHTKWDTNHAILSGDVMFSWAFEVMQNYPPEILSKLIHSFTQMSRDVCEGQQYDMDFPKQKKVSVEDYILMISKKTAALLGCSFKMGAIVGEAGAKTETLFYEYGLNLGIAFQLQDDYLDSFGDIAEVGKRIGGDIIESKKTILYLKALEMTNDPIQYLSLYNQEIEESEKIKMIKEIYIQSGAVEYTNELIEKYTLIALENVKQLPIEQKHKETLSAFTYSLMKRKA